MPQGLLRSLVIILPSYGVFVLTPAILVCPGKAGLYVELGGFVSTGLVLLSFEEELFFTALLVLQEKNKIDAQAKTKNLNMRYSLE